MTVNEEVAIIFRQWKKENPKVRVSKLTKKTAKAQIREGVLRRRKENK